MIATNHGGKPIVKVGYCVIAVLLAMSFVIVGPAEVLAQGTNATNATNASSTAGGAGGQTTVVMPAGSVDPNSATGYEPDPVTVSAGSPVVWDNQDNALHTATSGNAETATPDGKFDTGMVGAMTQSQPVTMPTEPGEYTYFCTLHPFLVGTVTVQ
ncbi:MAG: cupredoxin domain-containing protein [Nitrososphaeraceae archaeon]